MTPTPKEDALQPLSWLTLFPVTITQLRDLGERSGTWPAAVTGLDEGEGGIPTPPNAQAGFPLPPCRCWMSPEAGRGQDRLPDLYMAQTVIQGRLHAGPAHDPLPPMLTTCRQPSGHTLTTVTESTRQLCGSPPCDWHRSRESKMGGGRRGSAPRSWQAGPGFSPSSSALSLLQLFCLPDGQLPNFLHCS